MSMKNLLLIAASLWITGCGATVEDDLSALLAEGGKGDSIDLQMICDLIYESPTDCSNRCNLPADFAQRLIARGAAPELVPSFADECAAPQPQGGTYGSYCQTPDGACVIYTPQPMRSYCVCGYISGSITR